MSKPMPHFQRDQHQFLPKEHLSIGDVHSLGLKGAILAANYLWFRNISAFFYVAIVVVGYGYSTYGKIIRKDHLSTVVALIDHISHLLMSLANLSNMILIVRYDKHRSMIYMLIDYISANIKTKTVFGIISNVFNIMALLSLFLNAYTLTSYFGWRSYTNYIFRDIQFIFINLAISSFSEFSFSLRGMYSDLNRQLLTVYERVMQGSSVAANIEGIDISAATSTGNLRLNDTKMKVIYLYKTPKYLSELRKISKNHNELCRTMDHFNNLTGPILFFTVVSIVANVIWSVAIIIEYDIRQTLLLKRLSFMTASLISQIVSNLLSILLMVGQTILIGTIACALTAEGKKTSTICYKMLDQQPFHEEDEEAVLIKKQLTVLAKQAETRCPVLSAWGFFSLNLSVLGLVASNVIAYTIVAIQFILNEH